VDRGRFYAIRPVLPELHVDGDALAALPGEYSSANEVMRYDEVVSLLTRQNLLLANDEPATEGVELLR
jgi:UDP-glucose 4-epimerase